MFIITRRLENNSQKINFDYNELEKLGNNRRQAEKLLELYLIQSDIKLTEVDFQNINSISHILLNKPNKRVALNIRIVQAQNITDNCRKNQSNITNILKILL